MIGHDRGQLRADTRPSQAFQPEARSDASTIRRVPNAITIVAAIVLALAGTELAWPALKGTPRYDEPIVGMPTWDATDKERDFRAFGLFVGLVVAGTVGIHRLMGGLAGRSDDETLPGALQSVVGWSLVMACFWLGRNLAFGDQYLRSYDGAAAVLIALGILGALWKHRQGLTASELFGLAGACLLIPLATFGGACALATLTDRIAPGWLSSRPRLSWAILGIGASVGVAWNIAAIVRSADRNVLRSRLRLGLLLAQIPLPLLYFVLLTPSLVLGGQIESHHTVWLPITIGVLVLGAWFDLARKARRGDLRSVLSPLVFGAIAVFIHVSVSGMPVLPDDPFHFGEQILPWHQLSRFGKIPYVDFVPIHGLMSIVRGALNDLFFLGTAATFPFVDPLLASASVLAAFLATWAFAGPFVALYSALIFGLSMPTVFDRNYFLVPAVLILSRADLWRRPNAWLWAWGLGASLMVGYNFAVGVALAVGTAPVAAWSAYRAVRANPRRLGFSAVIAALLLAVAALIPLTRQIGLGFLTYFRENSATNNILHGIAWQTSLTTKGTIPGLMSHRFALEVIRMSWVAGLFVLGFVAWKEYLAGPSRRRAPMIVLCVGSIGTLLLLTSWTMGRIDPGHWSRPGSVSFLVTTWLLPAALLVGQTPARSVVITGVLAAFAGLTATPESRLLADRLRAKAVAATLVPADFPMVDGTEIGMPSLGRAALNPTVWDELRTMKATMDRYLEPDDTFLDLTNRSVYFFDLDRPVPTLYAANFVAANRAMQGRMLDQLAKDRPKVTLIGPSLNFNNVPGSMRSYELYRDAVTRSVAVYHDPFTLLVDPSLAPEAGPIGSEEQQALLDHVYWHPNLRKLPLVWGQSWTTMAPVFTEAATIGPDQLASSNGADVLGDGRYRTTANESRLVFRLDPTRGRDADFLTFRFHRDRKIGAKARMQIRWRVGDREEDGPFFDVDQSTLVVPLGAYPRWLLADAIDSLEFVVLSSGPGLEFRIDDAQLRHLPPVR